MPSEQEKNLEKTAQDRQMKQRRSLNNAYAAILASQNTITFAALTFEDVLDLQIERIEGESTAIRPNLLDRVDRIENEVLKTVEQLKAVPDEAFQDPDEEEDVNVA